VSGCGQRLDLMCEGGCLKITKIVYTCTEDNSDTADQLRKVQKHCEGKSTCRIPASRWFFGSSRCPDVDFKKMILTVKYICGGGGQDRTKVRRRTHLECDGSGTETEVGNIIDGGHSSRICGDSVEGPMIQKDVSGCGGKILLKCTGGCIRILKVLYSCEEKPEAIPSQVELVQTMCENKESCEVAASRDVFGSEECPDSADKDMSLWLTYRCDGGTDGTTDTGTKRCPIESATTETEVGVSLGTLNGTTAETGCKLDPNTTYYGGNVVFGSANPQPSLSACIQSCKQNTQCQFWSYQESSKKCFLKSVKSHVSKAPGYISGTRDCAG